MNRLADVLSQIPDRPGVYVLRGRNGRQYTGVARNLHERLSAHLAGKATRTKNQRPLHLVHCEDSPTYSDALQREQCLKAGAGRVWLKGWQTVSPQANPPPAGNLLDYSFEGSNPSPTTILMRSLSDVIPQMPELPGVYVLRGINGRNYMGAARNLRERLKDHNAGRGKRTKNQRPLELYYHEITTNFSEAMERERFLKSGQGRQWLKFDRIVSP